MSVLNFKEMFKGTTKYKLPEWEGYWVYDPKLGTIVIHCRNGETLNIEQTTNTAFTLSNLLSDRWIEATLDNCPVLVQEHYNYAILDYLRDNVSSALVTDVGDLKINVLSSLVTKEEFASLGNTTVCKLTLSIGLDIIGVSSKGTEDHARDEAYGKLSVLEHNRLNQRR